VEAATRLVQPRGGSVAPGPFDTVKVTWPLPAELPLVSVIVPTRDRLELLRPCIDSVLAVTSYSPCEVLVVDNGSSERATHEYLRTIAQHPAVRVLSYDQPYNFSAINNFAAAQASGAYLCLLNNDTEVIEERWLTEMMRFAVRDEIGAVGAKLLYGNGAIQHAGVVVGMGEAAGHAHRFTRADDAGYFRLPHVAHFVSAVTAACMVVAKSKFDTVGGLDEEHLAVAYNDVDFCLRLQRVGYRNVYVPHAVLLHHESMSRGDDKAQQHIERYSRELTTLQQRWGTKTYQDPLLNPNLDRYSETFIVALD
jgi:GT2 family glycosyltransferase